MRRAVVVSDDDSSDDGSGDEDPIDAGSGEYGYESGGLESSEGGAGAGRGGLVDLEAEESRDDDADDDDDDDDDGDDDDDDIESGSETDDGSMRTFHGFMQLPLELRYRVWEAFCPDLVAKGRFLQFDMSPASAPHSRAYPKQRVWMVKEWVTLPDQTESLRRVTAAHRESRAMALKAFPDTLSIDSGSGDALVHFNRNRDVVLVNGIVRNRPHDTYHLPGFADRILNMAVPKWRSPIDELAAEYVNVALGILPNLKRIYFWQEEQVNRDRDIRWCVSDYVHQYTTETFEKQPGLGENTQSVACWPDVDNHPDFAKYQIPQGHMQRRHPEIDQMAEEHGVELWPMVLFEFEPAMTRYRWLQKTKHIPNSEELVSGLYESSSDSTPSESGSDVDEYESDGIDDAEIIEDDDASEDEVVLAALSERHSSTDEGDAAGARFSSPEPEDDDDGEGEGEGKGAEPEPAPRPSKRRIVADSDDADDAKPDEPRAKRARAGRAMMMNSDDEEDVSPATVPVVIKSDSEPDDDAGGAKTATANGESSSSEDDSDDNDGSPPKQRMSLAERLRMSREAIPIPPLDTDDGSTEGDDEEEEEDDGDEDEEDDSGDGLIDGMAAELDGEGEGESDDGW
ncbi:Uncharacterized protein TCAP_02133 [Tolypocladium capitatum]|uniref:2EXR domain-containing protein n=1 Tax=Tolypocladium capitatum TaxID=45235 RepID=A0A2K3QK97_9HYPO|nr:Uncharacterized protein TCAP_02133 [Tolypocladium capitatum]